MNTQTENEIEVNPTLTVEEIQAHFADRWWRINNLYYIKDKRGNKVLFKPNPIQKIIHDNLWFFTIVPKARQLGVTTFFAILYFDQVLFSKNKTAGIIAHRQEDMKKIFKNKIKFAWDHMHPWVRKYIGEPNVDNANELTFPNGSTIFVSMSTRSGTINFLHISEFAYVCQKFPEKAAEIVTGAINSVEAGQFVSIESTSAGREGYFFDFCMAADKNKKERRELTELDWKLFFFPWHIDPSYSLNDANFLITAEHENYFRLLKEKFGVTLTDGQKRWWIKKFELNGQNMYSEYPSTLEEAFQVTTEGAYYATQMNRVYLTRRIRQQPHDTLLDVDVYWDLGLNDTMIMLFVQSNGPAINFIDTYSNSGEGLDHYIGILKQKKEAGYRLGTHYMPWDVEVAELTTGKTRKEALYALGVTNIVVAPKLGILDGIDATRRLFSRFYFDEVLTEPLYNALSNYRKDFDTKLGVWKNTPRHDGNSHLADAVRVLGVTWHEKQTGHEETKQEEEESFFGVRR